MKGNSNINRGLRFSDISNKDKSNRDNSNKDNPRFRNLKVNNKDNLRFNSQNNSPRRKFSDNRDNLRFNNQNNNLRRKFSSRKDKSKDLRFSNHNTLSLKENLKEGIQNIESRMTRSLKTLPSIISVGENKGTIIVNMR
jgi:hypothetical protein